MNKKISSFENVSSNESVSTTGAFDTVKESCESIKYGEKPFLKSVSITGADLPINVERDMMMEKIRQENRERKKRWRQANEDRNKDNDLRCRVNKRAHKLYGKEHSLAKSKWIETEFLKRQLKRKDRERKRSLESHIEESSGDGSAFLKHDLNNTGFNAVEFSQTFLENLYQNLVAFNHTIPFSLRTALISFSSNPNFLKIISNLFSSLTHTIPPESLENTAKPLEESLSVTDDATTQLYQSLLSNLFPANHEPSVRSSS